MAAVTKAGLEAQNERLRTSLDRAKTKIAALDKSPERAKTKIATLAKSIAEGREREKATAEILRVIRNSPEDAQPVFDAIARARCVQILGRQLR